MYAADRSEAAIFLYGLLIHNKRSIERKEIIVEALGHIKTKECAELLFNELHLKKVQIQRGSISMLFSYFLSCG
jgi:hypothetical protein